MKRFVLILIVLMVCAIGLGLYRGWFGVTTDTAGGNKRISITLDNDKIKADEQRVRDQLPKSGSSKTDGAKVD